MTTVTATTLNVRTQPSTAADVFGKLKQGDRVTNVRPTNKDWALVSCNAQWSKPGNTTRQGYVARRYLTTALSSANGIDWEFIAEREGNRTSGYVPMYQNGNAIGQSGVTIGAGFDLGQHNRDYLNKIGLPTALKKKLEPYLGTKKQDAIRLIKSKPLHLTKTETETINKAVGTDKARNVKTNYNNTSKTRFGNIPAAAQTVITSVLFQYGSPRRVPTFWRHATTQNWTRLIAELRDFGDNYNTRRNIEADYLQQRL